MGGAERQVMDIARGMSQYHEVCICYLTGEQAFSTGGAPIHVVGLGMRKRVVSAVSAYLKLQSLVREFQPDIVHSHMVHANLFARLLRLVVRFPVLICTAHSTFEGGKLRMLAYRLSDRLADLTTNVSLKAVEAFEAKGAVHKGQMRVVPNGVDTDLFRFDAQERRRVRQAHGVEDCETLILSVGRLVEAKDYPTLLSALLRLKTAGTLARLWVIGEGEDKDTLFNLARHLGLQDDVLFMGARHDIASFYSAADLYVLSSAWEGFGMVVAEAMATECIVVATDCGGVREVIGLEGFLVPPRNPELLASHIRTALELSTAEKTTLGARARERVIEKFSLRGTVATWQGIYTSLLAIHS